MSALPDTTDTSDRILAAAERLFGERGYDAVSARDIALEAGVNKALVFYHHGSKEALFGRVLEGYYDAHRRALEAAFAEQVPARERLHHVIDAYLDFVAAHRNWPRLVQRAMAGSDAPVGPIRDNLAALFDNVVAALSEIAPAEGPLAARHFFLTFSGAVINYFTYGPVLESVWGSDPLSDEGIEERRAHLHWVADRLLDGLG